MVRFKNQKYVSNIIVEHFKDLSDYILHKFFTKAKVKNLDITIVFKKNLFKEDGIFGSCIWEDVHFKPNKFTIEIDPDQKLHVLLNCLAHEMVHVKQWAKGEYYQSLRNAKVYFFNKTTVDTNKVVYWEQPWEIEATGRAFGLVVMWAKDRKIVDGIIQE
jgi:hypothetical protein